MSDHRSMPSLSRRDFTRSMLALTSYALLQSAQAATARLGATTGNTYPVHDPCIIRSGSLYHLFSTGHLHDPEGLIPWRTSSDLNHWKLQGKVFAQIPKWALEFVPGARGLWAPDIAQFNDRYHLYYSVSTFGSNHSAIGLATNATLDPKSKDFGWRDEGMVIKSTKSDDFNAIDPNHIVDAEGHRWLALGSFWSGLKLFPLDPITGKVREGETRKISIASRPAPENGPQAVEAPFIVHREGYYFLFASYDYCCRGVSSSYYTAVGRARNIVGPYLGRNGTALNEGYGTMLLRGDRHFRGPGHCAVLKDGDADYLVHHAYDVEHDGRPTLRIARLEWRDGWPTIAV
jgi:arabinan endo-1,5-alpha-L-arabinosidase